MSKYEYEEALREDFKKFAEMNYNWAALSTLSGIATVAAHWAMKCKGEETAEARAGTEPADSYVRESEYFQLVRQHKALSEVVMKLGARVEELAGQPAMRDFKSHMRVLEIIRTWTDEVVRLSQIRLEPPYDPHALVSLLKECGFEIVTVRKGT